MRWKSIELEYLLGVNNRFKNTTSGRRCLIYHGIDHIGRNDINSRFISVVEFEKHLIWLKEYCHVVSLTDYFSGYQHPEKLTVSLTFDDGYRNNLTLALPLLEKYKLPATFFITASPLQQNRILWPDLLDLAGFVLGKNLILDGEEFIYLKRRGFVSSSGNRILKEVLMKSNRQKISNFIQINSHLLKDSKAIEWRLYWELMNDEEILLASQSPLITIGSHSILHTSMDQLSFSEAEQELLQSKSLLESLVGKPITAFAFPFGNYTPELIEKAIFSDYKYISCVDFCYGETLGNPNFSNRFGMNHHISLAVQVAEIKRGSYL
ncbi:MAG TPA: polysaccharide deacetylase family protein [Bacteroidia bacterium]|nr:polysaccharide deacetylase family protein [Bacteroidia bacterium]